jgi:hypothetical protein
MNMRFSDDWEGYTKATAAANRLNKIIAFDALSNAKITQVLVGFDGEGDQGQMERAVARSDDKAIEFPNVILSLWVADFGCTELSARELCLQEAVEHLCYGYLEDQQGGWQVNDGSFGEFTFDVAARTITLDFYGRVVENAHSRHTL